MNLITNLNNYKFLGKVDINSFNYKENIEVTGGKGKIKQ